MFKTVPSCTCRTVQACLTLQQRDTSKPTCLSASHCCIHPCQCLCLKHSRCRCLRCCWSAAHCCCWIACKKEGQHAFCRFVMQTTGPTVNVMLDDLSCCCCASVVQLKSTASAKLSTDGAGEGTHRTAVNCSLTASASIMDVDT